MWRAGARAPIEGRRRQMQETVVGVLAGDRCRAHHEPYLELYVRDRRLYALDSALGHDARRIARVGLPDRQLAERQALGLVGIEQARPGNAVDDRRELPGE